MSEWKEETLKDYVDVINGFAFKSEGFSNARESESYLPVIKIKNVANGDANFNDVVFHKFSENLKKYLIEANDILIALTGNHPIDKTQVVGGVSRYKHSEKSLLNQRVGKVVSTDASKLNEDFLYYFLKWSNTQCYLANQSTGSASQANISKNDVLSCPIELPEIEEQKRIAKTLSNLDQKITLLREQNQTLEELAQVLFKRWFVDFNFPDDTGKPYKDNGGAMQDSELGEIPVGWRVGKIGDEIETIGGGTPSTKEPSYWDNGNIIWYSPTDLTRSKSMYTTSTSKMITDLGLKRSSAKLFPKYSILMTSRATVGEITINICEACTNQGFIVMIPNEKLSLYFLYTWLKSNLKTVHNLASGSTFPEISKSDFRNIEVVVGSYSVLSNYNETIKPIFKSIENNILEIEMLAQLRDTLLPKLMSGELRIKA